MTEESTESPKGSKGPFSGKESLNADQLKARRWWTFAMIGITIMLIAITKSYWVVILGVVAWYFGLIRWMRFLA